MVKQKKKRNKVYRGADASTTRPVVTRISAANRNRLQQWWFEKKRIAKPVAIAIGVLVAVAGLIAEIIHVASGS
jgi:sensor c-di-GMP phosphodiesterase-like protein